MPGRGPRPGGCTTTTIDRTAPWATWPPGSSPRPWPGSTGRIVRRDSHSTWTRNGERVTFDQFNIPSGPVFGVHFKQRFNQNSTNSSRPPSSDPLAVKAKRRPPPPPSGRNRGGQPGHKRHTRALVSPDQLHETFEIK